MIGEQNARVLREILELPYTKAVEYQSVPWKSTYTTDKVDESNFDMLKLAYQTCLDHDAIEAAGTAPLEAIIAEQDSIWPINTADLKSTIGADDYAAFSKAVYYMEDLGISSVLKVFAGANIFKDSVSLPIKFGRNCGADIENNRNRSYLKLQAQTPHRPTIPSFPTKRQ